MYGEDLAYIHDVGFGDFARQSAAGTLKMLHESGITSGLVVDLGCGSGIWARALIDAGHRVRGVDISPSMIALSRRRVPEAEFETASFLDAELPPCQAVTSLGECLSYMFNGRNDDAALMGLFRRVFDALRPGGVFIFDVSEAGRGSRRGYREGDGWAVAYETREDPGRMLLTRMITTYRRDAEGLRSDHEVHVVRLFDREWIMEDLHCAGFDATILTAYGDFSLPEGVVGFLARRP